MRPILRFGMILLSCLCLNSWHLDSGFRNTLFAADQITPEQVKFFETHVRPLLVEQCYKCHSDKSSKGGLRVDSRGYLVLGGDSGAAIEPGKPDESLLMEAVRYESYEMPPSKKMSDEQIDILAKWIEMGAPWPGDDGTVAKREEGSPFSETDRNWWAFQPVKNPQVPPRSEGSHWGRNEIDRFIAAQHREQKLAPAPEAERRALIRRVYFDLIGLPPTPEEIQAFEDSTDPLAYEKIVDDLLSRPEYGERWARHWLDLVRYAESDGFRVDFLRPQAWRYRDYVIQSFNEDKPYDRFVQEQLAGDELFPDDPAALTATGYLRHGIYEYNARDARGQWDNMQNEITDVTGDVFFGLGFQCARCHDHKYDPILQKDYYQLRAFFESVLPRDDLVAATQEQVAEFEKKNAEYLEQTKVIRAELEALLQPVLDQGEKTEIGRFPDDIQEMMRKKREDRTPQEEQLTQLAWRQVLLSYSRVDGRLKGETKEKVLALRRELAKFDNLKPEPLPQPMMVTDVGAHSPLTIIPKRKTEVEPGFPSILESELPIIEPPANVSNTTGRRAALAIWLTRPENPLSTRVIVNRVWQYHFHKGLAENSSDFGRLGDPPTHPELLDWLTTRFLESGWRFKDLHKLIVTSATYRQSTAHPQLAEFQQIDPSNRWYWRGETRRLDAEQIRDAIFAVSDQLKDQTRGGPSVQGDRPRRSIYTRVMRNSRDPLLDAFDLPQFFSSTSNRDTTTSPVQSLLLINSQTMLGHAGKLANAVNAATGRSGDIAPRIERLWWVIFGRGPTLEELNGAMAFLREQEQRISGVDEIALVSNIVTGKVPYRDGQAVLFQAQSDLGRFVIPPNQRLDLGDLTIEAFFQLRSIYESGEVRTLASKTVGNNSKPGWLFGITGKGSRRKPQTLVMQMYGQDDSGKYREAALFSDHHLELNKPYYAAVSVRLAKPGQPGVAKFYLKDLSNDDEPLLTAELPVPLASAFVNDAPLSIGSRGLKDGRFDGLIDDVRLSKGVLPLSQLLFTSEGITQSTVGYWQFEPSPGMFHDSLPNGLNIRPVRNDKQVQQLAPNEAAFVDLCHVLLNSNEFLYVD
ncbi:MAG TPA: DUF1549 domain-containing protein [Planctomicrobium sp.]|nr:DUF1549 domain-containing protein [Planctomicrobium sp.]